MFCRAREGDLRLIRFPRKERRHEELSSVGGSAVLVFGSSRSRGPPATGAAPRTERTGSRTSTDDLRRLTPTETREVVTAICEATRRSAGIAASRAHDRAASNVSSKFSSLDSLKNDTISDAKSYKDETLRALGDDERMTRSLRGKNHPVVRYMIEQGNAAHADRQSSSSYCTVSEHRWTPARRRIYASNCTVIELKPDNSRAISKGRDQARRYADELNNKEASRKKLAEKNSSFGKCEKYDYRVTATSCAPRSMPRRTRCRSASAPGGRLLRPPRAAHRSPPRPRRERRGPRTQSPRSWSPLLRRADRSPSTSGPGQEAPAEAAGDRRGAAAVRSDARCSTMEGKARLVASARIWTGRHIQSYDDPKPFLGRTWSSPTTPRSAR